MAIFSKKWQMILLTSLIIAAVIFLISVFVPPKYKSQVSILIIPQIESLDEDISGNARYLGQVLADSLFSTSFISSIEKYSSEISNHPEKAMKDWKSQVKVDNDNKSAVIHIEVFDTSRAGALKLSEEISGKIISSAPKYIGQSDKIKLEVISGPISFMRPAKPNVVFNAILGFFGGLALSYAVIQMLDIEIRIKDGHRLPGRDQVNSVSSQLKKELGELEMDQEIYPIGKMMRQTMRDLAKKPPKTKMKKDGETDSIITEQDHPVFPITESVTKIEPNGYVAAKKKITPFVAEAETSSTPTKKTVPASGLENLPFALSEDELPWKVKKNGNQIDKEEAIKPQAIEKKEEIARPTDLESPIEKKDQFKEPTEEEIKERLNKLLKGEF